MPIRPFRADDFNAIGKIYLDAKYAELAHEPHVFKIIPLADPILVRSGAMKGMDLFPRRRKCDVIRARKWFIYK